MKFEVIAFDMDGTLTPSKSPLEKDVSELFSKLLREYKVSVISGATLGQFEKQFLANLSATPEQLKNLYLQPTNGSVFCSFEEAWKCTSAYTFSDDEKKTIINAIDKMFVETEYQKPEKIYGELIEDRDTQITFSALGQEAPLELKKGWDPDYGKRRPMADVLSRLLPELSIHVGGSTSIDITRKGIDKAYGITELMKKLGVSKDKVLYVADDMDASGNNATVATLGVETRAVKGPEESKQVITSLLSE